LNLDEFAMGSTTKTSYFGFTKNPWKSKLHDKDLIPGGSSGGSAAGVSAGLFMAATGTDTGGSIRQPAGLTGICGMKPTYGRCSRFGVVAFSSSLDHMGPMARTVYDCALMLENMAGYDAKDSTCAKLPVPKYTAAVERGVKGLKIGIPAEYDNELLSPEVKEVWQNAQNILREAGAEIVPISMPATDAAVSTYYIIAPAEASANLARYDGVRYGYRATGEFKDIEELYMKTRSEGFGDEVKRRVLMGTEVLSSGYYDAYYNKACKVRRLIRNDFNNAFTQVDAILVPTTTGEAYTLDAKMTLLEVYLNDVYTIPANMSGVPAMSVPAGNSPKSGLPLGLQVMGKYFNEETVFAVARVIERETSATKLP
ncbi:MAG TPA: amidase family protein, partial [Tenuifilaceae bacterium]|nr:amidase family protein [Tenuifilaceae bacterium]